MSEAPAPAEAPVTAFDFAITLLNGQPLALDALRGKVLLLVNTASRCGFTPQYEGLQTLHESFGERGLVAISQNQSRVSASAKTACGRLN